MELEESRIQATRMSPEICIVVDTRIMPNEWQKADALHAAEGSSPDCVMASDKDTTGVYERGMHSKG